MGVGRQGFLGAEMAPGAPNHPHTDGGLVLYVPHPPCPGGDPPLTLPFPLSLCSHRSSEEWQKVSKSEREKMGVTVQDDGEFW